MEAKCSATSPGKISTTPTSVEPRVPQQSNSGTRARGRQTTKSHSHSALRTRAKCKPVTTSISSCCRTLIPPLDRVRHPPGMRDRARQAGLPWSNPAPDDLVAFRIPSKGSSHAIGCELSRNFPAVGRLVSTAERTRVFAVIVFHTKPGLSAPSTASHSLAASRR